MVPMGGGVLVGDRSDAECFQRLSTATLKPEFCQWDEKQGEQCYIVMQSWYIYPGMFGVGEGVVTSTNL